ncbi:response regulator transcription factor [Nocardioides piscis]|uniref:Response regulator transcription factor n=1 Tax=Nocardioides piscis TaxID=2714938 RepID=A0A6G7YI03_9ACTN|nr:response regulator transcription factor [Nocardioides piscis]QIK76410.1 response regulator transcription factor [Nocardioides piscis]
MSDRRVLVVEDDRVINDQLAERLRAEGYAVDQVFDGPTAVTAVAETRPDVVLLDVMLPGLDGHEVCRRIQSERPVPVLMLTARDDESDILVGLGVGADDYLTKPFRMREVVARVAALMRRVDRAAELAATTERSPISVGRLVVDPGRRRTAMGGTQIHLTPTEFDLLVCLAREPGQVLTRERLLSEVWGWGEAAVNGVASRTVDSHVKALRHKLGAGWIRTVHGVGYALEVPA